MYVKVCCLSKKWRTLHTFFGLWKKFIKRIQEILFLSVFFTEIAIFQFDSKLSSSSKMLPHVSKKSHCTQIQSLENQRLKIWINLSQFSDFQFHRYKKSQISDINSLKINDLQSTSFRKPILSNSCRLKIPRLTVPNHLENRPPPVSISQNSYLPEAQFHRSANPRLFF